MWKQYHSVPVSDCDTLLCVQIRATLQAAGQSCCISVPCGSSVTHPLPDCYALLCLQIRATLQAARQRFDSVPVWVVFQPHTYSRTARLMDDLAEAFSAANRVIVTEVSGGL